MYKILLLLFLHFYLIDRIFVECRCGIENKGSKSKDAITSIGKLLYPWLAHIRIKIDDTRKGCTGTLIDNQHLITARNCLYHNGKLVSPKNIFITFGTYQGKTLSGEKDKVLGYAVGKVFSDYGKSRDLAILKLQKKFKNTRKTAPICVEDIEDEKNLIGSRLYVLGWLDVIKGFPSRPIQEILDYVSADDCSRMISEEERIDFMGGKNASLFNTTALCAIDRASATSLCSGILGSPIMVKGPSKTWNLIGVVTSQNDCKRKNTATQFLRFDSYKKLSGGRFSPQTLFAL